MAAKVGSKIFFDLENGAIYLINPKSILNIEIGDFKKVRKYKMSKKDSVDLDDPIDWMVAEALMIN